jgi:hypothetical protein
MARKDFGSNDGRRLSAMADLLGRDYFLAGEDRRALLSGEGA